MFSINSGFTANIAESDQGIVATSLETQAVPAPWTQGLFQQQWAFSGVSAVTAGGVAADISIQSVWGEYTGLGVRVALIDNFFDIDHADLQGRFDLATSRDLADAPGAVDIRPDDLYSNHGTMVAAVIGANGMDGTGMTGTAFGATLVGYVLRFGGTTQARSTLVSHLTQQLADDIDVVNNSWSFSTAFADDFNTAAWADLAAAINAQAALGRGGLGTVMVVGAGNDRQFDATRWWLDGDNTNHHSTTNNRAMITVAATTEAGAVTEFSTPGASVFVAAPGEMMLTANISDNDGNAANDYIFARGTSFATPVVSGVVALMLEANADLGYRDVQDILALSSRRVDPVSSNWSENGASVWNGGGFFVNSDVGFGLVDAHAAVRLAETWTRTQTRANEASVSGAVTLSAPMVLTEGGTATAQVTLTAADAFKAQWIELAIDIAHPSVGDLTVVLVSPSGMRSVLIDKPAGGTSTRDNLTFTLSSNQFWGEDPTGTWTVEITDGGSISTGTLRSAELRVYGTESADDTYVFTDDFAALGRDSVVISDTDGIDSLNLSALSTAVIVDLEPGHVQSIAGYPVTIDADTYLERAFTGDGNDQVRGNSLANTIATGRGDDIITMTAGADTLSGGAGEDTLLIDGAMVDFALRAVGTDVFELCRIDGEGHLVPGTQQRLTGIETLTFADASLSLDAFLSASSARFPDIAPLTDPVTNGGDNGAGGGSGEENGDGEEGQSSNVVIEDETPVTPSLVASATSGAATPDTASFADVDHAIRARLTTPGSVTGIGTTAQQAMIVLRNMIGSSHSDRLSGNDDDNLLNGGLGADTLIGGDGNDQFIIDTAGDTLVETATGGHDSVMADCSYALSDWIEDLTLTGAARDATGNGLANRITGNGGNNLLDGRGGDDTLSGGIGNDRYVIDSLGDVIVETANEGIDSVSASVSHTLESNVEQMTLTGTGNIEATGNALDNKLTGNAGDNRIDGGSGADWMAGGDGNDVYIIDNARDRVAESAAGGSDTILSSVSLRLFDNVETATLTGRANLSLIGNSLDNVLTGNDGNNRLVGLAGNDTLAGGNGNDRYDIDSTGDVIIEAEGAGIDTVYSTASYAMQDGVEQVVLLGTADLQATGNALNNNLTGNAGANILDGGLGADWMSGGAGDDTYYVDNVRDRVAEGQNRGHDTVYASVSMRLGANIEALVLTGSSNLNAVGNASANTIAGTSGNNRLAGGLGNDTLSGGAGEDVFIFDTRLNGTTNVDTITDFDAQTDSLALDDAVFSRMGARGRIDAGQFHIGQEATGTSHRIIYDNETGSLYYDRDGSGRAEKVLFAKIGSQTELSHLDFFII